jgi:imidazolonepropionase-like amidohydrolase
MEPMTTRIDTGLLIPGRGAPIADASVLIDGSTIEFAGPRSDLPSNSPSAAHHVRVLMPGLWDCHGHFWGYDELTQLAALTTHPALAGMRVVNDARKAVQAGFTSVREVGGLGIHLARAVAEGSVLGPNVYAAGALLSPTGGHADIHAVRASWVRELGEDAYYRQCDGVPECLLAVRSQLRAGARVIKICATGGVLSERDHPDHQQFSPDELRAIVEEAARSERVVAAHCLGKAGAMAALNAGVRTIEHGAVIDEEVADAMLASDAILVPTRLIIDDEMKRGLENGLPQYIFDKELLIADRHWESLQYAISRGVRIALGTDCYSSQDRLPAHWGMNGTELQHLVAAGMTPLAAIEAATATAPLTLGPQAPLSGRLAAGYDADLIAVSSDPLTDISVLANPQNIEKVWLNGRLVKDLDPAAGTPATPGPLW